MDRIEIVDPGANGEAGFSIESKKWPAVEERVIMLSTAGTEYTLSKPSLCPYYGDHLRNIARKLFFHHHFIPVSLFLNTS